MAIWIIVWNHRGKVGRNDRMKHEESPMTLAISFFKARRQQSNKDFMGIESRPRQRKHMRYDKRITTTDILQTTRIKFIHTKDSWGRNRYAFHEIHTEGSKPALTASRHSRCTGKFPRESNFSSEWKQFTIKTRAKSKKRCRATLRMQQNYLS